MKQSKILVVDDEPGITSLCERLLRKSGYIVFSTTKPLVSLKILEENEIDLFLVDIKMPEINGFELITKIRQIRPGLAVLVMTGFGTIETAIEALHQDVDGLVLKPFKSGHELVITVEEALTNRTRKSDLTSIQTLRPLYELSDSFLKENRYLPLINLVLDTLCKNLHCENAGYYKFDKEKGKLALFSKRGICPSGGVSSNSSGIIGKTDFSGIPVWLGINRKSSESSRKKIAVLELNSIFCSPITRPSSRGVLFVGRGKNDEPFREVDWEMFLLISRQAAIAIENAFLYEELREYVIRIQDSQQALLRFEKMAAVGRLTASIAHEINNPLQAVQNCLHLATRGELTNKKQKEYIHLAKYELDRLMNTVQRMLDLYRPGAVEPQQVRIGALLKRVYKLLYPQLKERNIRVQIQLAPRIPPIIAVENQLEQVFINLILNAYDAMPNGGEIIIEGNSNKKEVEMLFQDNGPGIKIEDQKRIFEPFVSTKKGGTGLGLSVSYGIISAHGGSLDLLEKPGSGACFRVLLPLKGDS